MNCVYTRANTIFLFLALFAQSVLCQDFITDFENIFTAEQIRVIEGDSILKQFVNVDLNASIDHSYSDILKSSSPDLIKQKMCVYILASKNLVSDASTVLNTLKQTTLLSDIYKLQMYVADKCLDKGENKLAEKLYKELLAEKSAIDIIANVKVKLILVAINNGETDEAYDDALVVYAKYRRNPDIADYMSDIAGKFKQIGDLQKTKNISNTVITNHIGTVAALRAMRNITECEIISGNIDVAKKQLDILIKQPKHKIKADLLYNLGMTFSNNGYDKSCIECLEHVIANYPKTDFNRFSLGHLSKVYIRKGDISKSLEIINKIPECCNNELECSDELNYQALELFNNGYYKEAKEVDKKNLKMKRNINVSKRIINSELVLGNYETGSDLIDEFINEYEIDPELGNNLYDLASYCSDILGYREGALKIYEYIYRYGLSHSVESLNKAAAINIDMGQYEEAMNLAVDVIQDEKGTSLVSSTLIDIADKLNDKAHYSEAIDLYSEILDAYNEPVISLRVKGKYACALINNNDISGSESLIEDLEDNLNSENSDISNQATEQLINIGYKLNDFGNYTKTKDIFTKIIKNSSNSNHIANAIKGLVTNSVSTGDIQGIRTYVTIMAGRPLADSDARILYELGMLLSNGKYVPEAEECFTALSTKYKGNVFAKMSLGHMSKLAIRQGETKKAMGIIEQLPSFCFSDEEYLEELNYQSSEFYANGYYDEAIILSKTIIEKSINGNISIKGYKSIISSYLKSGQPNEAKEYVDQFLKVLRTDDNSADAAYQTANELKAIKYDSKSLSYAKLLYEYVINNIPRSDFAPLSILEMIKIESKNEFNDKSYELLNCLIKNMSYSKKYVETLSDITNAFYFVIEPDKNISLNTYLISKLPDGHIKNKARCRKVLAQAMVDVKTGIDIVKTVNEYGAYSEMLSDLHVCSEDIMMQGQYEDSKILCKYLLDKLKDEPQSHIYISSQIVLDLISYIEQSDVTIRQSILDEMLKKYSSNKKELVAGLEMLANHFEGEKLVYFDRTSVAPANENSVNVREVMIRDFPDTIEGATALVSLIRSEYRDDVKCLELCQDMDYLISNGQIPDRMGVIKSLGQSYARAGLDNKVDELVDTLITEIMPGDLWHALFTIGEEYWFMAAEQLREDNIGLAKYYYKKAIQVWKIYLDNYADNKSVFMYHSAAASFYIGDYESSIRLFEGLQGCSDEFWNHYEKKWDAYYLLSKCYEHLLSSGDISKEEYKDKTIAVYDIILKSYPDCPIYKVVKNRFRKLK